MCPRAITQHSFGGGGGGGGAWGGGFGFWRAPGPRPHRLKSVQGLRHRDAEEAPGATSHPWPLRMGAARVGVRLRIWYAPGNRSGDLPSALCLSYRWTNRNRRGAQGLWGGGGGGQAPGGAPRRGMHRGGSWAAAVCVWGGGYFGWGHFWGEMFVFRIGAENPP